MRGHIPPLSAGPYNLTMARTWVEPTGIVVKALMVIGIIITIVGLIVKEDTVAWIGLGIWGPMILIDIMYVLFRTKWHQRLFVDMAAGGYPPRSTRRSQCHETQHDHWAARRGRSGNCIN